MYVFVCLSVCLCMCACSCVCLHAFLLLYIAHQHALYGVTSGFHFQYLIMNIFIYLLSFAKQYMITFSPSCDLNQVHDVIT